MADSGMSRSTMSIGVVGASRQVVSTVPGVFGMTAR